MPDAPELLVIGSVALDTRDGPFGKVHEELGGSAVYFALAASLIVPVAVSAPVGRDGAEQVTRAFEGRPIDTSFLRVIDAPTYRWKAHQEHGRNLDLGSVDRIYDRWEPEIPPDFAGWAFIGSMRPDRQDMAIKTLHGARRRRHAVLRQGADARGEKRPAQDGVVLLQPRRVRRPRRKRSRGVPPPMVAGRPGPESGAHRRDRSHGRWQRARAGAAEPPGL